MIEKKLYLIFTEQGFLEAKDDIIKQQATLWINPNILSEAQLNNLAQVNITPHILDPWIKPSDEKTVLEIIKKIEQEDKNINILVEYL